MLKLGHILPIWYDMLLKVQHINKLYAMLKKPTAQIAHLVFADTQANAEKPKELLFAHARQNKNER